MLQAPYSLLNLLGVRLHAHKVPGVGLPDLPYFTGDPVFQTLFPPPWGKPPGRTNLPHSVSQIVASLRRHCDT